MLIRYFIVGVSAYAIEMAVLFVVTSGLKASPLAAVTVSFWVGFVVAFIFQKMITFKNHENKPHRVANQLILYSCLVAWNYGFTLLVTTLFAEHVSVYIVRTIAIAIILMWNFLLYKAIFKQRVEHG